MEKTKKKNQTISGFAQQSYLKNTWPKSLNSSCHKTRQHVTSRPACKGKAPISRAGCAGWHPTAVLSRGPHDTLVHTSLHYPPPAGGSLMLPISHFLMLAEQTCSSLRAPPAPRPGCSRQSPSETPRALLPPTSSTGPPELVLAARTHWHSPRTMPSSDTEAFYPPQPSSLRET